MTKRDFNAYTAGAQCARRLIGKLNEEALFEPESGYMVFGYCACVTGLMMAPTDRVQTIPFLFRAAGLDVPRSMKAAATHPASGTSGCFCDGFFTQLATHFERAEPRRIEHA